VFSFIWLGWRVFVWSAILAVYTNLLLFSQPDWLSKPGNISGWVEHLAFEADGRYVVVVGNEETQKRLYIDRNVYNELSVNDQVSLLYLPVRLEAVRCEVTERYGALE